MISHDFNIKKNMNKSIKSYIRLVSENWKYRCFTFFLLFGMRPVFWVLFGLVCYRFHPLPPPWLFHQFYNFVDYDHVLWSKIWLAMAGDSHCLCLCFGSALFMNCLGVDYVLASRVFSKSCKAIMFKQKCRCYVPGNVMSISTCISCRRACPVHVLSMSCSCTCHMLWIMPPYPSSQLWPNVEYNV